jgi:alkanesulfonate monooxygenase SsuD/methylene tetrahydromethanopterin reductase-like flavin-dependent oxidoreductase (luciferase family)
MGAVGGERVRFFCGLSDCRMNPVDWAAARRSEGWHGVLVADHLFDAWGARPHVWSVLGMLAAGAPDLLLGTGYANNLVRHPVEFAQASLTMQRISGGRFDAGLGAGWTEDEMVRTGRNLPPPAERAGRLIEAVQIVRDLLQSGSSRFRGRYYTVDVERLERLDDQRPPRLVVGAGGPRLLRAVAPLVDKLELMPAAVATRTGQMNMDITNRLSYDDIRAMVDRARSVRADITLGIYIPCCAGDDERTKKIASLYDGFFADFQGSPSRVADNILALGEFGIDEFHLSASDAYTYPNLAPQLLNRLPHVKAEGV